MSEDVVRARIDKIREAGNDEEKLKECLCSFFLRGDCPTCVGCLQEMADLRECRKFYFDHIRENPMDIWSPEFEVVKVISRDKVSTGDLVGIGIRCDNCYMSEKCPLCKPGYECGIDWGSEKPATPEAFYEFLVTIQYERVKRASVFEKVDGGVPDQFLSNEMDRLSGYILNRLDLNRERLSVNIEATCSAGGSAGGGILAKLFSGGGSTLPASEAPKEIPAEVVKHGEIPVAEIIEETKRVPRKVPRVNDDSK